MHALLIISFTACLCVYFLLNTIWRTMTLGYLTPWWEGPSSRQLDASLFFIDWQVELKTSKISINGQQKR